MIRTLLSSILTHIAPTQEPDLSFLDLRDRGMSAEDYYLLLFNEYKSRPKQAHS